MNTETTDTGENVVELITESLMPGHRDALRRIFNSHGARSPMIIWSPQNEEMQSAQMRRFAAICEEFADAEGRIKASAFDPQAFNSLANWIMVVAIEGDEYRYLHYGRGIADFYGRDMTGETTEGFTSHIAGFFKALYRAAAERHEWVLSEHEPPARVFVRSWRRLIVPLSSDDGEEVTQFAVINLPENELRAGLELMVDPVFVLDAEQTVQYANRSARRMFGIDASNMVDSALKDLTTIDLDLPRSPGEMLAHEFTEDSVQLYLRDDVAERLVTTVSAAEHRGTAFYIVVMRLIGT